MPMCTSPIYETVLRRFESKQANFLFGIAMHGTSHETDLACLRDQNVMTHSFQGNAVFAKAKYPVKVFHGQQLHVSEKKLDKKFCESTIAKRPKKRLWYQATADCSKKKGNHPFQNSARPSVYDLYILQFKQRPDALKGST